MDEVLGHQFWNLIPLQRCYGPSRDFGYESLPPRYVAAKLKALFKFEMMGSYNAVTTMTSCILGIAKEMSTCPCHRLW